MPPREGQRTRSSLGFESEMTIMTIIEGLAEAGYEHADMDGGRGESEIQRID
jgi:hypothetical protein